MLSAGGKGKDRGKAPIQIKCMILDRTNKVWNTNTKRHPWTHSLTRVLSRCAGETTQPISQLQPYLKTIEVDETAHNQTDCDWKGAH